MALNDKKTVWLYVDDDEPKRSSVKAELHGFGGDELWVPKSCIGARGDRRIEVAAWWAAKNGFADDKDEL